MFLCLYSLILLCLYSLMFICLYVYMFICLYVYILPIYILPTYTTIYIYICMSLTLKTMLSAGFEPATLALLAPCSTD